MPEFLFNSSARDNSPLSRGLLSDRRAQQLANQVRRAATLEDLGALEADRFASAIYELRRPAPRLGGVRQASVYEGGGRWRDVEDGYKIETTRIWFSVQIESGDPELLKYWPDEQAGLTPVDADVLDSLGGMDAVRSGSREAADAYFDAADMWKLGVVDDESQDWAAYTFVDLTRDEVKVAKSGSLRAEIERRVNLIRPIAAAIAEQTERFYDESLPERLTEMAAARREELQDMVAMTTTLKFKDAWVLDPPRLGQPTKQAPGNRSKANETTEPDAEARNLTVLTQERLDPASFDRIQQIIRVWANAVEKYPQAFALHEDRVSDLLAATLVANVPGADREVYTRGGKSDIYIRADALDEHAGPANVFVCEAKWADAKDDIVHAIENQLFRYCQVREPSAILLALCRQNIRTAEKSVLEWAQSVPGWVETTGGPAGWPLLRYELEEFRITIALATVALSLPRKRTSRPSGKRAAG